MSHFADFGALPPSDIWGETVRARWVHGERLTLACVELAPGAIVPEHRHPHEQYGFVVKGSVTFTIDGETQDLGPGGIWRIAPDLPHTCVAGREGALVVDLFAPVREDWSTFTLDAPRPIERHPFG